MDHWEVEPRFLGRWSTSKISTTRRPTHPTNQLGFKRQGLLKSKLKFLPILQNVYISKQFHLWLGCHKKGLSAFDELVLLVCVNLICKSTTLIIDVLRTCAKKRWVNPKCQVAQMSQPEIWRWQTLGTMGTITSNMDSWNTPRKPFN